MKLSEKVNVSSEIRTSLATNTVSTLLPAMKSSVLRNRVKPVDSIVKQISSRGDVLPCVSQERLLERIHKAEYRVAAER
jgi:hypothetical protein